MYRIIPVLVLALLLALRAFDPAPVRDMRLFAFDMLQLLKPRPPGESQGLVRVIAVDDESLNRLGQWPWPRTRIAAIVDRLAEMGAASVTFDILFAEPDRLSPGRLADYIPESIGDAAFRQRLQQLPENDAVLAGAMRRIRAVTAFAGAHRETRLPAQKASFAWGGENPAAFVPGTAGATTSLPILEDAAAGNGVVNWVPDPDQIVRRIPVLFRIGDQLYPSLFAETLRVVQGANNILVRTTTASGELDFGESGGVVAARIGRATIPTDRAGQMVLHFRPMDDGRYIPAWRILEPDFDPAEVRGRIILIGATAAGQYDIRATPLQSGVPGVEVQAQAIEQVIDGVFLHRPDYVGAVELLFVLVIGVVALVVVPRFGAVWGTSLGFATIGGALAASWFAFDHAGWVLDWLYPSMSLVILILTLALVLYFRTEAQREEVRNAFGRYLSPVLVEQLAGHPERLALGGEIRETTILFSDIRGFTGLSEQFDAKNLTAFMNRYFTGMTQAILEQAGTVDKFIGDAVMAFWNAPIEDPDHARHACRAALGMIETLERLNPEWMAEGVIKEPVRMGIGLNTADCCVGNLGSDMRFDYSVLGDGVNLASRIEGQTKVYGVPIIIGPETERQAPGFATVELDFIRVRGKRQPERIYALLGDETAAADPWFAELKAKHDAFRAAYLGQDWAGASAALTEARAAGGDRLAALYAFYDARIAAHRADPPPADWDGVYEGK